MAKTPQITTKKLLVFVIAFFLCFAALTLWNTVDPSTDVVMLADEPLHLYVADSIRETYVGLGGRDDLDGKDGMLFLLGSRARHGIVMRDMRFPIDIVWLDQGVVVDIAPAVPIEPDTPENELTVYRPRTEATMVIELRAGWTAEHGLEIGDTLRLP